MASVDFEKILFTIATAQIQNEDYFDLVKTIETIVAIRDGTYTGENANAIMTILQACNTHVANGNTFLVKPVCYAISRFTQDATSSEIVDDSEEEN